MKTTKLHLFLVSLFCMMIHLLQAQSQRTIDNPMPTRQVHLDFHTSEYIPDIGTRFDKKQFQEALKVGNVNHINIFSKGHHGWSYYPTKIGKTHPNLDFDLLGAQLEACHEIGVEAPFYFTIGWSELDAREHPEWTIRNEDGSINAPGYDWAATPDTERPTYLWKRLDPSIGTPYHEQIMKQVEEICQRYPDLDGFWFDIYHVAKRNYNSYAMKRMKKEGIDINDTLAVERSHALALKAHMKALRELVAKYKPEATVYFNAVTRIEDVFLFKERLFDMDTHQDLEDLPTTWGGYNKLPLDAKYHLQQGVPAAGMSGKFHKAWGEFGGFKNPDAIKYEAAAMISFGASCNFGDQLHPSGEMDMETYKNIGHAYEYVEQIEDYGPGGVPVSKLGMWLTLNEAADHGVVNMLLEIHEDFIVADEQNLDQLELLIIPSEPSLNEKQAAKIATWVQKGGKLIVFADGALNQDRSSFLLDVGATYLKPSDFQFDYTVVKKDLTTNIVSTPFLNYDAGLMTQTTSGEVLASIREPYFNRTYDKFNGHRETPYRLQDASYPAIVKNGNVLFFAHPLDQLYYTDGVLLHRQLVKNAIRLLYQKPLLKVSKLPSAGRVSLLKQAAKNRYVAHLLYGPPLLRGEVSVLEDFLPVPGVELSLAVPESIKEVVQIPDGTPLPFAQEGSTVKVTVPTFTMHTAIVFKYE
ncbi:hypothetical protein FK220_004470 [Flavobacteriaceae bacterium TP-CH-4]|uniref:Glycosyl hydrolase-like family 6 (GHL6) protein n=1 Tax=Pelagihabitans pacificus TaxID=2696054 RepID=A0A967E5X6_9FLAO|nr:alpha-amylase family protein [Pelagihabitans pacificus]NHF58579.1 hypothetical protein [Pelagihabitans pacificus]